MRALPPPPTPTVTEGCIYPSIGCLGLVAIWVLIVVGIGVGLRALEWAFAWGPQ